MPKRSQDETLEQRVNDVGESSAAPKMSDAAKQKRAQDVNDALAVENEEISEDEFEEEEIYEAAGESDDESVSTADSQLQVWTPGAGNVQGVELEYDPRAYDMLHGAILDWSCYSFAILPDVLGMNRSSYPHTVYVVAGTQAEGGGSEDKNRIYVSKWHNLKKTCPQHDSDSDDASVASDEDADDSPILDFRFFNHPGGVNRLSVCPQLPRLVASCSDNSDVYVWDIEEYRKKLESPGVIPKPHLVPKYRFSGHTDEGFAIDFNPLATGVLATGARDRTLRVWSPVEGGWEVEAPIQVHKDSVEAVAWRRAGTNANILASASVDRSICIFDLKTEKRVPQITVAEAHASDVNVIAWSPFQEELLLSGGDDGVIRVWDTRNTLEPIVDLKWHKEPISSVEWHPCDSAMFAVASLDNTVSLWDMSVEPSDDAALQRHVPEGYPEQLMFQHMGQTHISEVHWHPQVPGVLISTAEDGFNIFKTSNI